MQSFDIVTLRVFLAVVRLGSIGAAAKHEHIATSAASRRISDLENNLDSTLISRTPAGVTLTPAGHAFARHCEQLLKKYADIRADLKRFNEGHVGHFRIGVIPWAMSGTLPPIIAQFKKMYPAVHVTVQEIFTSDGIRFLREDLADLVMIYDSVDTSGYETKLFKEDPVYIIGREDHPLFQKHKSDKPIEYHKTLKYEHISFHEGGILDELISEARRQEGMSLNYDTKVMRVNSLLKCAEADLGLGIVGAEHLLPILKKRRLRAIPLADSWASRNIISVYAKAHAASPITSAFLECLQDNLPE